MHAIISKAREADEVEALERERAMVTIFVKMISGARKKDHAATIRREKDMVQMFHEKTDDIEKKNETAAMEKQRATYRFIDETRTFDKAAAIEREQAAERDLKSLSTKTVVRIEKAKEEILDTVTDMIATKKAEEVEREIADTMSIMAQVAGMRQMLVEFAEKMDSTAGKDDAKKEATGGESTGDGSAGVEEASFH